jgi:hypothetical protein
MEKEQIHKDILGITYQETIMYFDKFSKSDIKYYFRPIRIDNTDLWFEKEKDELRCNVIVKKILFIGLMDGIKY